MDTAQDTTLAPGIVSNPGRMRGRPTIAGTRITVERVLSMIAGGYTFDDILRAYPHLTREQITAAVAYAEQLVRAQRPVGTSDENPDDLGEVFG